MSREAAVELERRVAIMLSDPGIDWSKPNVVALTRDFIRDMDEPTWAKYEAKRSAEVTTPVGTGCTMGDRAK